MPCKETIGIVCFIFVSRVIWTKFQPRGLRVMSCHAKKQLASYILSLFQELFWTKFQPRGLRVMSCHAMKQLASYVLSLFQELFWTKFQRQGLRVMSCHAMKQLASYVLYLFKELFGVSKGYIITPQRPFCGSSNFNFFT